MTRHRRNVSLIHNFWNDAQRVDRSDLRVEQDRNVSTDASIVQNHFGSGVLLENPTQLILFDSDNLTSAQASILAAGNFDGQGMQAHAQPSDINLGNQIEVELTDSNVIGRLSIKVAIIGLSFDDSLQIDRFYFYKNEKQVTSKHYKRILALFFNDFKGNNNCSRNLGGRIVIREAASFQLSRDALMVAQDVEPDLFWRDFKVWDSSLTLSTVLQNGIGPEFSVDALDINTTGKSSRQLSANDVTTRIGQKFLAKTDNIQKITLLLGVQLDGYASEENQFNWLGDIVISVFPLQTTTSCPTDIVPNLAIEFDPASQPLSQLSFNQNTLEDIGYVLTDALQPVDFVFNSTKLGSGTTSSVESGKYYAVTIGRSGAASNGTILVGVGNDKLDKSRLSIFTGVWTDVVEEDLWFQVWTDAAKIADGRGYDNGNGMQFDKTTTDSETGSTIDNEIRWKPLTNTGEDVLNIGVLQASEEESVVEQDERTGNNVFSRKKFIPEFSFVDESELNDLKENTDPIIIGCTQDINPKQNPLLDKQQNFIGLTKGDRFCVINPDADLLSLNLVGSKLIPNTECSQKQYRIFKVELCTDGYGDVNSDGYIDSTDIARASELIGESLSLTSTQQKIIDGYIDTLEIIKADVDGDGYVTANDVDLITQFVNKVINSFPIGATFKHICLTLQQSTGRYDGYFDCDGYVRIDGYTSQIVDPNTLSSSQLKYDGYLIDPVLETDPVFVAVPFSSVPYQIKPQPYWQPHFVIFSSDARIVPAAFPNEESLESPSCIVDPRLFTCEDTNNITPECDPGRNDFYVPGNLIIDKGQIVRPDGSVFRSDIEIGVVTLQLPELPLEEVKLNVFDKFVASRGDNLTRGGYPAMRYSDCSFVQDEDLVLNKIRFNISVQAHVPNFDGYDPIDGYVIVIDDIIGVHMDHNTGILSLTLKDLSVDEVFKTLITKIQIIVYLKKSGWVNIPIVVEPEQLSGLLS